MFLLEQNSFLGLFGNNENLHKMYFKNFQVAYFILTVEYAEALEKPCLCFSRLQSDHFVVLA